ncbi:hypothetical protein FACS1894167_03610 [Synergistales bacterium]|nr:hypothetical protein FACS1894167_03610 [Synergistales bacterium]GHV51922.1 hypothetical protein FACS1894216_07100 [Synergistales bacterium]
MIRSAALYTYELEDSAIAVAEINAQLSGFKLLTYTVGVLMCDTEFVDSGVYSAICAALPFDVAGTTTMTQAVNGEAGILMLTVMVLTSDDVFFEVGYTESIPPGGDITEASEAAFESSSAKLPSAPKLILVFPPLIVENAGDGYIGAFESLCPNTPIFGTLAIDGSITFENCYTFHNGDKSKDKMAFILAAGNLSPRFFMAIVADENRLPYSGEITKSEGHIVQEVNNVLTSKYFESIGFAKDGKLDAGLQFVPFLIDFKNRADRDGTPVVRAMVCFDENGYGVCRGYVDQGSVFVLTNPNGDDIFKSSLELVDRLRAVPDRQATIIFSCVVRRMAFGMEPLREAEMTVQKLSGGSPFMFAYAGGEICPTSSGEHGVTNRFHNYSIIACVL